VNTPTSMRAAVYHDRRDIRLEEVPVPAPAPGELMIEVGTVGVCGSDVGEYAHGPKQHPVHVAHPHSGHLGPIVPGHEFSGTVVAVGDGVDPTWVGATVASCGSVCCGTCPPCLRGESNLCTTYSGVGLHRNGALTKYVVAPLESCARVDHLGLSLDEAALCQPMSIAVHNVRRVTSVAGETVLLQGAGGIGAFLVYALTELGARVIATDIDEDRLRIATELGAVTTVALRGDADDVSRVRAAMGDAEVRILFEVSGSRQGLASTLELAPRGAKIVLVGIQHEPVSVDLGMITLKEQTLLGTNALVRETDFPTAVELVARRRGRWAIVAPKVLPLDRLVEGALQPMSEGRAPAIKTLIDPQATTERDMVSAASQ
jgi:(R,R)-butanediol dehydrogenase/meso-butanediol dehydrogenase/diacetyl reductase